MEAMTLEQVRDALYAIHDEERPMPMRKEAREWAAIIGAHLAQPAQAVDVEAIREVIERLRSIVSMADKDPDEFYSFDLDEQADKLTAALTNANGKEG